MRLNFAAGILAGIAVAALLVAGSSYYQTGAAIGPGLLTPFGAQSASTASTITLSSTSHVVAATSTSTSSTTSSLTQGGASVATKSNATSTSVAGNLSANVNPLQSSVIFGFASASQPPSSLAAMVYQPGRIPLLLIPILAALGLGFVLYRAFVQKE